MSWAVLVVPVCIESTCNFVCMKECKCVGMILPCWFYRMVYKQALTTPVCIPSTCNFVCAWRNVCGYDITVYTEKILNPPSPHHWYIPLLESVWCGGFGIHFNFRCTPLFITTLLEFFFFPPKLRLVQDIYHSPHKHKQYMFGNISFSLLCKWNKN